MVKKNLSIIIFFLLALPIGSNGFVVTSVGNNLLAEVKPANPSPGELVTIGLTGYGFNLDTSDISWYVNDKLKAQSTGNKSFSFNLGPVGQQTKVVTYVQSRGGQKASKTFIFDPAEIELFWETPTSKPIFYQGKALASIGSKIKVVALPYIVNRAGQKIDPTKLTYRWQKDGSTLDNLSGPGKNSITVTADQNASQVKIIVEILSLTDKISANKILIINLVRPEIVFYEKKPLTGVNYGQVLPVEYSLFADEVTVRAEPYFLPLGSNSTFKYLWTIDQSSADGRSDDPLTIVLRRSRSISGSNRVSFSAQGPFSTFGNSFIIKYGNSLLNPSADGQI